MVGRLALVEPGGTVRPPEAEMPPSLLVWGEFLQPNDGWVEIAGRLEGLRGTTWRLLEMAMGDGELALSNA